MTVSATIPISTRTPLVQTSQLDPKELILWAGTAEADATGSEIIASCICPPDLGCMWIMMSGQVTDGSASDCIYAIAMDNDALFFQGESGVDVNDLAASTKRVFDCYQPPRILLTGATITCQLIVDNVDDDDLLVRASAFVWDIQIARNIPQKFFWPQLLG